MPRTIDSSGLTGFAFPKAQLSATVAGNALTIAVKNSAGADPSPTNQIYFAVTSNVDGSAISYIIAAPLSLTVPNGATLGAVAGQPFRLWILAFDDGGTIRLAVSNRASGTDGLRVEALTEDFPGTTDLLNTSSDNRGLFVYSSPAIVTPCRFRMVGYVTYETPLASAGVWNVAPDIAQMCGPTTRRPGDMVQEAYYQQSTVDVGILGAVPFDDTIPLQNEMRASTLVCGIFSNSAANRLEHSIEINGSDATANDQVVLAAYNSVAPTAPALAASFHTSPNLANAPMQLRLLFRMLADRSVSVYTAAVGTASGAVFTVNGVSGVRKLGGVLLSSYSIREIMG